MGLNVGRDQEYFRCVCPGQVANVTNNISRFPITKEAAALEVGNAEVVEGLISQPQGLIQVFSDLKPDSTTPTLAI